MHWSPRKHYAKDGYDRLWCDLSFYGYLQRSSVGAAECIAAVRWSKVPLMISELSGPEEYHVFLVVLI